ncbi:unnamed protein product [Mytilus coruscus]|uniref:PHD-type domain-containing protein n=1 Tax=Mytilus coruscus TaxID=42192 RepID=A0A6J8BXR1_MYTCO|nr:unnamed protein product [Mytilus coruscus]
MGNKIYEKKNKNLSLRKSHPLEKCRAEISQNQIDQYYDLLESTLKRLYLMNDPTRIYNCDESGFSGRLNAVHALEFNPSSCASQSRAVNDGDDPEERQTCDSCGHSKDNILVKMGFVSADLANILVEPPKSKQIGNEKQSKRKTLNTARVNPSISATDVTFHNTDETTVPSNDEAQPGSSGTNIIQKTVTKQGTKRKSKECTTTTRKKKTKKCMKKSKAVIDDDNVLCIACMTNNQQFYWVGCDRCDNWVHYECLPARVQTDVDLSLITDEPWYCNVCVQSEE